MRRLLLASMLVLGLAPPLHAGPVSYNTLSEYGGILNVDGYEFWIRDVIPSSPHWLFETPPFLLFVQPVNDGGLRFTYFDDLWLPGAVAASAWVYRDIVPIDAETAVDEGGHLLYVETHEEHAYLPQAAHDSVSVPEPSSMLLFGLGSLGLVTLKRRRQ